MSDQLKGITCTFCVAIMLLAVYCACKSTACTPQAIEMEITAYCPCEKCCGDWADGFFADGSPVGGKAIAADTRYYPMGTLFDVPGYGVATVKDRGGAIKGDRLDLYFPSHQEALEWGRQFITVTRLEIE